MIRSVEHETFLRSLVYLGRMIVTLNSSFQDFSDSLRIFRRALYNFVFEWQKKTLHGELLQLPHAIAYLKRHDAGRTMEARNISVTSLGPIS